MASINDMNKPLLNWLYTTNWVNQEWHRRLEVSIKEADKFNKSLMSRLITFGQQYCKNNNKELEDALEKLSSYNESYSVKVDFEGKKIKLDFLASKIGFGFVPYFYGYTVIG